MSTQPVSGVETKLRKLLIEEFESNETTEDWLEAAKKRDPVKIRSNQFTLTPKLKADTQDHGKKYGCHTCDTHVENDPDQPWVGDHFPPTKLKPAVAEALNKVYGTKLFTNAQRILRPQCNDCSNLQASFVVALNHTNAPDIIDWLATDKPKREEIRRLLLGEVAPDKSVHGKDWIWSSGDKVTGPEGIQIQVIGVKKGCHSNSKHKFPVTTYFSDHIWPQEFNTSYFPKVLKALDLEEYIPDVYELRPQCPRCSCNQGGRMKQITELAVIYASTLPDIVSYKETADYTVKRRRDSIESSNKKQKK